MNYEGIKEVELECIYLKPSYLKPQQCDITYYKSNSVYCLDKNKKINKAFWKNTSKNNIPSVSFENYDSINKINFFFPTSQSLFLKDNKILYRIDGAGLYPCGKDGHTYIYKYNDKNDIIKLISYCNNFNISDDEFMDSMYFNSYVQNIDLKYTKTNKLYERTYFDRHDTLIEYFDTTYNTLKYLKYKPQDPYSRKEIYTYKNSFPVDTFFLEASYGNELRLIYYDEDTLVQKITATNYKTDGTIDLTWEFIFDYITVNNQKYLHKVSALHRDSLIIEYYDNMLVKTITSSYHRETERYSFEYKYRLFSDRKKIAPPYYYFISFYNLVFSYSGIVCINL
jgi:hypothetical protein